MFNFVASNESEELVRRRERGYVSGRLRITTLADVGSHFMSRFSVWRARTTHLLHTVLSADVSAWQWQTYRETRKKSTSEGKLKYDRKTTTATHYEPSLEAHKNYTCFRTEEEEEEQEAGNVVRQPPVSETIDPQW